MTRFEFISDTVYRDAIERSFRELEQCILSESWRAALLLAGGTFESLLTAYLLSRDAAKKYSVDLLKLQIDKSMGFCLKEGLTAAASLEAKQLVLLYRKLIHPNADIRLKQVITESDATIAMQLLEAIIDAAEPEYTNILPPGGRKQAVKPWETDTDASVAQDQASFRDKPEEGTEPAEEVVNVKIPEREGPSAKEVLNKVLARNLRGEDIGPLIKPMSKDQRLALIASLVPKSALSIHNDTQERDEVEKAAAFMSLRELFRLTLGTLDDELKAQGLSAQAALLSGKQRAQATAYIDYLFHHEDLALLEPAQATMVKKFLFQRMEKEQSRYFLDSIVDIWYNIAKDEIDEFTNICLSCVIYGATQDIRIETKAWMNRQSWEKMDDELRGNILAPLQRWIENYEFFNDISHANMVRELKSMAERN